MHQFLLACLTVLQLWILSPAAIADTAHKVKIGVGGQATLYHLPLAVAVEKGYFKDEGLEVEIVDFAGGGKAVQALVADGVDVVAGAFEHTLRTQARGLSMQAFVVASAAPQIAMVVSQDALPGYQSLAQLRGKTIAISAPGSGTHMVATLLLNQAGVRSEDVSFIGLGTGPAAIDALVSGKVQALVNTEPLISLLEQRAGMRVVADTRTAAGTEHVFGGPIPANVLFAKTAYIEQNPQTVQQLTNAMLNALDWLREASAEEVSATVPKRWQLDNQALYKQAFSNIQPSLSSDGRFNATAVENIQKALSSFDKAFSETTADLDATWTNRFVDGARNHNP
ncbi:ABC transporter substrate-binding protein [Pseudomonas sp. NPDC089752]|uniref:ABC transporter substrate-binding protein n=1 Tax=Pseudomonas sp. NPDC089752 TaxID=3364472 RepID=UPI00380971B4